MKSYLVSFLLFFISHISLSGQEVHVKYFHVRSPIATLEEDLYVKDNQVISIQDSVINFNQNGNSGISVFEKSKRKTISKQYFVSDLNEEEKKNFFFTTTYRDEDFFIYDEVPKIKWTISEKGGKKILGYPCFKATGIFRGSKMVAYYTSDIPLSAGPFKFYGLPGLILEIKVENKSFHRWKAKEVSFVIPKNLNFKPQFETYTKTTMKEMEENKRKRSMKRISELSKKLPLGQKISSGRKSILLEKEFEWEQE